MYHKRLDNGCEARIIGTYNDRILVEARWPISAKSQTRNTVELPLDYFEEKYGFDPR